jgi:general secretion pathway protein A
MDEYITFYSFSEDPFHDVPNPKFFFPAESHNEALLSLRYGISERKGFILLLGDKGIGKTILINHLISTLGVKVETAFIPRCDIPYKKLLEQILRQLDVPFKLEVKGSMLHGLYYHLITCLESDKNVVIILDEAHCIDESVVEEVRLLANLETDKSKLLQIVLCGEPDLLHKLRADAIRQIGQRIVINCRIGPMTEEESFRYIDHRLKIVGSSSSRVFTDKALSMICRQAGGIPSMINTLCGNALSLGCDLKEEKISAATVRRAKRRRKPIEEKDQQRRILRIPDRLPFKIFVVVLFLMVLATAFFFAKDPIKNTLSRYAIHKSTEQKALEEEAKRQSSSESALIKPSADVVYAPTKPEQPSAQVLAPVTPVKQPDMEIRVKKVVEVTVGISLYSLTREHYNTTDRTLIDHILELNPSIKNPDLIHVKQKIKLPEITDALLIKRSPEGAIMIHLITRASRSLAVQYGGHIGLKGKKVEITPRQVSDKEIWYRVMVGPFADWGEASTAIGKMRQQGYLTYSPADQ